jgi:hypothetical protein
MQDRRILLEEGRQRLVRARHGYVLYNRNDTVIGRLIELYGEYFETEVAVFRQFMAPGDVAVDVGATPRVLHLCDPDPEVDNNFGGVELGMLDGAAGAPPVPLVALDEHLALDRLKLVKIDVEGMEAEVLRGAAATLARHKPLLYVENAYVDRSPELIRLLREYGYDLWWHLPVYVTAGNFFGNPERPYPVAFVDRGGPHLDGVGFAINLLGVHGSLAVGIQGLRPVGGPEEHPYRRECVQDFTGPDGRIGLLRE